MLTPVEKTQTQAKNSTCFLIFTVVRRCWQLTTVAVLHQPVRCADKRKQKQINTVPRYKKSSQDGHLLVRSHRFCPLFTMGGSRGLVSRPGSWPWWISFPPELRGFLLMFSCDVTLCCHIFFAKNARNTKLLLWILKFLGFCIECRCKKSQ